MKRKYVSYDEFTPNVVEVYDVEQYIVEDDPELQPAIALNQMLKNYGPAKVFSGYTSPDPNVDIPVTPKNMDIHDVADAHRKSLEEYAAEIESRKSAEANKAESAEREDPAALTATVTNQAADTPEVSK